MYGGWLAVRQRERADWRAEWRHRLEIALAELSHENDAVRRRIGRELLRSLATDELLAAADRELARSFLRYETGLMSGADPLGGAEFRLLDGPASGRDNEDDGATGGEA